MAFSFAEFPWSLIVMMVNLWNGSSSSSSGSTSTTPAYCSAAEEVAENEDLLSEVLLCLPVKSLLRFRCVSKKWNSIISGHGFAISHTRRVRHPTATSLMMLKNRSLLLLSLGNIDQNLQTGNLIHETTTPAFRTPSLEYLGTTPAMTATIISLCNGLMLCHTTSSVSRDDDNNNINGYYVTNISIKKLIRLPQPGTIVKKPVVGLTLAFDPVKAPHFKVLCACQSRLDQRVCEMEIYSSETREWRRWNGRFVNPRYAMEVFDRGVLCNGALHWLCPRGDSFYFTLEDEAMKVLPMPHFHRDLYATRRLRLIGEARGYLHLVDVEATLFHNPPIVIYQMKENYGGWVLKQRVNLYHMGLRFPDMVGRVRVDTREDDGSGSEVSAQFCTDCTYYSFEVLSVIWAPDGQSLDIVLLIPHRIIKYNTKFKTVKVLLYFQEDMEMQDFRWYNVYQFTDTLSWFPPF